MIKIGDLVIVKSEFATVDDFLGIVVEELPKGVRWKWTVAECKTGDYVPCMCEELTVLTSPRQADDWEKKKKIKKLLDKHK